MNPADLWVSQIGWPTWPFELFRGPSACPRCFGAWSPFGIDRFLARQTLLCLRGRKHALRLLLMRCIGDARWPRFVSDVAASHPWCDAGCGAASGESLRWPLSGRRRPCLREARVGRPEASAVELQGSGLFIARFVFPRGGWVVCLSPKKMFGSLSQSKQRPSPPPPPLRSLPPGSSLLPSLSSPLWLRLCPPLFPLPSFLPPSSSPIPNSSDFPSHPGNIHSVSCTNHELIQKRCSRELSRGVAHVSMS